ncbi:glycerol-3-phosphate acyltransferase [Ruminiclostridium hungatei]|uniref:Glycerol-3-phosphate acyltransferase n=1 Tax=Ruminiclostridium hungatei TaxID=48256 RepID=A0A1V4SL80_RUMHU|nr:glycerol-3-phosphate 1-O-acyltransferase PlsY [Ruminiclostridium hungatei]OPX44246.1 glycerol-3-phosphate acyltransferase [Ruminiclostridium hungatei]
MGILIIRLIAVAVIGYLLGSLNTSIIVGKLYGTDIRKHGSGNAGMTNTLRTLGKAAALMVIAGDILKGVVSYLIGQLVVSTIPETVTLDLAGIGGMAAGMAAIAGHNWPVYFGFRGGKGILTSFAVVMMMDWKLGLILLGIFAVIVAVTRYVSLGSIIASAAFPVGAAIKGNGPVFIVFSAVLAILAVARHSGNIKRLLSGSEAKLGQKKKANG